MEAKWNYAFWLQNEIGAIGGNDKNLRLYFKEANLFYTQQEYSRAEKMEKKISWMNKTTKCSWPL